jgi:hypothetical protein
MQVLQEGCRIVNRCTAQQYIALELFAELMRHSDLRVRDAAHYEDDNAPCLQNEEREAVLNKFLTVDVTVEQAASVTAGCLAPWE